MAGDVVEPDDEQLERAVAILRSGGLVAFPTETVYGLGADAADPAAVERVFATKGRPAGHPVIVHLASPDQLDDWAVDIPPAARLLAEAFWPGPLTLVLRRAPTVPDQVTGGRDTVGLRVPDHPVARALLARFGNGLAAPSANRYGRVSPTTASHVHADLGTDVDLVLDGGPCPVGVESTIVDLTGDEPELLRSGGVSVERLAEVLGRPPRVASTGPAGAGGPSGSDRVGGGPSATGSGGGVDESAPRAPGMVASHYAPRALVELVAADDVVAAATARAAEGRVVGVLAPHALDGLPPDAVELEPAGDTDEFAHQLYGRLRQADRLGLDVLLVVPPPEEGVGSAVLDRLRRAAAPRPG